MRACKALFAWGDNRMRTSLSWCLAWMMLAACCFLGSAAVQTDNGVHAFPVTCYTAETITKFTATGGGKTGDSGQVVVNEP